MSKTFPELMAAAGFNPSGDGPAWLALKSRVAERTVRRAMAGNRVRPIVSAAFARLLKVSAETVESAIAASKGERSSR